MERKPEWLKIKLESKENYTKVKKIVADNGLHTICSSGKCPNIGQCWSLGTATFMILGDICTRACKFCATQTGKPLHPDSEEFEKVSRSIHDMRLKHCVITSVDRDDLPDKGASHWARTIEAIRKLNPQVVIEVLVPDFDASPELINIVLSAKPDIFGHNMETVERLTHQIRSRASYSCSLNVLQLASCQNVLTKSGIMVGLGEKAEEVIQLMKDLKRVGCSLLTIGQYLQPTKQNIPVMEYVTPEQFEEYKTIAVDLGFSGVESAPLVRSSYMAEQTFMRIKNKI